MSKTCGAQYILKDCQCIADPFDRYATVCGYISKVDGLLYSCDDGCCSEKCDNLNKLPTGIENRPSAGVSLPPGYGNNLQTSSKPNPVGTPFSAVNSTGPLGSSVSAWKILLIAVIPLILVVLLSCLL